MRAQRRASLVEQVRRELLDELADGRLPRGTKLPAESDLAERFAVSRATVREAVVHLLDAGLLARRHGSGTYVTGIPRGRHPLDTTMSYTAMIRDAGFQPGETVIDKLLRAPDAAEREQLELGADDRLVAVERVRLAGTRPVIYSRDRIPAAVLHGVGDDELDRSLYAVLDRAGHAVARATARLVPTVADGALADRLQTEPGVPLLHVDQVDYDARGRPVMLSAEWHVADAFDLIVNRRVAPHP